MPSSTKEHSSSSSKPQSNLTATQAVATYLAGLTQEEKAAAAPELNAFARWFGLQRPISSITPPHLDTYQEQFAAQARTDLTQRLEVLKAFLSEAKKQGWTERNLGVEIKIRKPKATKSAAKDSKATPKVAPKRTSKPVSNGTNGVNSERIRLTREGYDKLARELEYLETVMRSQIALELKTAAADKDFRENAPYDVAKNHQAEVETRIRQLKDMLQTGEVVEEAEHAHIVDLGSVVTLHDLDEDEEIIYTIVGPGEIDPKKGKISIQSPVGKALSGKVVGDHVEVEVPAGRLRLKVTNVERR